jgi:hypothetical protein
MPIFKYTVASGLAIIAMATAVFAQPDIPVNPNPAPEEIPAPRQGRYDAVESIEVSPDGKSVFINGDNGQTEQRLLADGTLIRSFAERK